MGGPTRLRPHWYVYFFFKENFSGQARPIAPSDSDKLTWPQIQYLMASGRHRLAEPTPFSNILDLGSSLKSFKYQTKIILLIQWKITLDKIEYYLQPKYHPKSESNAKNIARPNPFWVHLNYIFNCVSIYHHSFFLTLPAWGVRWRKFKRFKFYSFIINPL